MMKTTLVASLLIALMAGCASGPATAPAASGPTANVAGAWSGSFGVGAGSGSMSMTLQQTGNQVKGEIDIGGRSDMSGPMTGTVSGDTIQVSLTSGYGTSSLLTVKGDQITGVYQGGPIMLRRSK